MDLKDCKIHIWLYCVKTVNSRGIISVCLSEMPFPGGWELPVQICSSFFMAWPCCRVVWRGPPDRMHPHVQGGFRAGIVLHRSGSYFRCDA